ncbi:hypothetical protein B1B_18217, partial [mine drainage metagenome]
LYNLNILQENVGAADVYPSAATLAQYIETIRLGWQILPPGTLDDMIRRMLGGKQGAISQEQEETMRERLAVMDRLKPGKYIAGTSEFLRYFGAMFEDDFVVFENVQYGNALYVMFENWEALSRRSRIDLLKGERDGFKRILHGEGWADKLKALLREHRTYIPHISDGISGQFSRARLIGPSAGGRPPRRLLARFPSPRCARAS